MCIKILWILTKPIWLKKLRNDFTRWIFLLSREFKILKYYFYSFRTGLMHYWHIIFILIPERGSVFIWWKSLDLHWSSDFKIFLGVALLSQWALEVDIFISKTSYFFLNVSMWMYILEGVSRTLIFLFNGKGWTFERFLDLRRFLESSDFQT